MNERGWDELDILIVSGDAYVDHPSYGAALIGRLLESEGYRVGIIAQPEWRTKDAFMRLGKPRLFTAISAGNLDSMVANYTANGKPRRGDDYSPGGEGGRRPDRATIVYTNRIREAFDCTPVIIAGIEASMRRLAHYDYWSDKVRRSLLFDSKADILVYGMAERQILEIARRLTAGEKIGAFDDIRGTVVSVKDPSVIPNAVTIPSFEEVSADAVAFNEAIKVIHREADPRRGKAVIQPHGDRFAVQLPPAKPLGTERLDALYALKFIREPHPEYTERGGIPGFETVRFSITSHRGCPGACNFCSLYLHQGRIIQSRSARSIVAEADLMSRRSDFKGTITDIGGPTANLYEASCESWESAGGCADRHCLTPKKCSQLKLGYDTTIEMWREVSRLPRVKHLFIGSGMRFDLLVDGTADSYLRELCARHVSGRLKVAPEHSVDGVLKLMNKSSFGSYEKFAARFKEANAMARKEQFLVNYFIVAHPGATLRDAAELAAWLRKAKIDPEQIQDYIPLPMTISGAMYYTEKDPFTGTPIYVAKTYRDRMMQRALLQPRNHKLFKYLSLARKELEGVK